MQRGAGTAWIFGCKFDLKLHIKYILVPGPGLVFIISVGFVVLSSWTSYGAWCTAGDVVPFTVVGANVGWTISVNTDFYFLDEIF